MIEITQKMLKLFSFRESVLNSLSEIKTTNFILGLSEKITRFNVKKIKKKKH